MKIEHNDETGKVDLNEVTEGDPFYHNGCYWISTEEERDGNITCVDLNDGELRRFPDDLKVELVDAKLVIL